MRAFLKLDNQLRDVLSFNKRGQVIGKLVTTFPVMILIFVVMVIFLVLAVLLAGLKGPELPLSKVLVPDEFLLLKSFEVEGEKVSGFDLAYAYLRDTSRGDLYSRNYGIFENYVRNELKSCLFIYGYKNSGGSRTVFICNYDESYSPSPCGKVFGDSYRNFYFNRGHLTKIPVEIKNNNGKVVQDGIAFYQGECIHNKKGVSG